MAPFTFSRVWRSLGRVTLGSPGFFFYFSSRLLKCEALKTVSVRLSKKAEVWERAAETRNHLCRTWR